MLIRRVLMVLFLLTQVAVAAAAPAHVDAAAGAMTVEHCSSHEAEAEPSTAPHAECDDGCQLCAACAPGLATAVMLSDSQAGTGAALFPAAAPAAGALTALLRPPSCC